MLNLLRNYKREYKMLQHGLKNYFKSLKYFFTPLGTMFLGMMIGFSILFPGIVAAISQLSDGIVELSSNVNLDFNLLWEKIWEAVRSLDWNRPMQALQTLLSAEWLNEMLTQILNTILGTDFETFKAQITLLVTVFTGQIAASIVMFFVFWILGFWAGLAIVKYFIRRTIARRSAWKIVLAYFINSFVSTGCIVLMLFVFALWRESIFISLTLIFLFGGALSLLQAYLLHGYKIIRFKDIVNFKNIGLHMLSSLIIFLISIAFTLIAVLINNLMGLFVGLALIVIALIVIDLNAESYVLGVARNTPVMQIKHDEAA